jgi:hypothetical protein
MPTLRLPGHHENELFSKCGAPLLPALFASSTGSPAYGTPSGLRSATVLQATKATEGSNPMLSASEAANFFSSGRCDASEALFTALSRAKTTTMRRTKRLSDRPFGGLPGPFSLGHDSRVVVSDALRQNAGPLAADSVAQAGPAQRSRPVGRRVFLRCNGCTATSIATVNSNLDW